MLTATLSLFLSADAATTSDMTHFCPNGYITWNPNTEVQPEGSVPEDQWYYGNDWAEWMANGTKPTGFEAEQEASINPPWPATTVYPAGFKPFTLKRWSEPPICILVSGTRDKKVEILMESPMDNANLCITDASYSGAGLNDVGSVQNCGTGKIYACFTAATASGENFGFYVDCQDGCEDMDIDVWIRVRVSEGSWDEGKTDTASDLEHWCEKERGLERPDEVTMYYTYPSDLVPDKPSKYPFHIQQIFGTNSGSQARPNFWAVSLIAFFGLACLFA